MIRINSVILLACALVLCASPAWAGPLATAPGVYNDGSDWHGSAPFQGYVDYPLNTIPSGLSGTIDYAVWGPNDFPAGFSGYTPTAGEFTYAYQILVSGSAPVSQSIVFVVNEADNIGEFTGDAGFGLITGIAPSAHSLVSYSSAQWTFNPGVDVGMTSVGLIFSSLNAPDFSADAVIDDGTQGIAIVPAPLGAAIPEPTTMTLALCGIGALSLYCARRRRRTA